MVTSDTEITLYLNVESINLILAALSELPFKVSSGLISKISEEAKLQLSKVGAEDPAVD